MNFQHSDPVSSKLKNSFILKDLDQKLSLLSSDKILGLKQLKTYITVQSKALKD